MSKSNDVSDTRYQCKDGGMCGVGGFCQDCPHTGVSDNDLLCDRGLSKKENGNYLAHNKVIDRMGGSMNTYIHNLLEELAEIDWKIQEGSFPTPSLTYKIMHEGPTGAAIKSSKGNVVPLPDYHLARRLVKLSIAKSELGHASRKFLDDVYQVFPDPRVARISKHLLNPRNIPTRTFYRRLDKIHATLNKRFNEIRLDCVIK